jgi:hypothetical protein
MSAFRTTVIPAERTLVSESRDPFRLVDIAEWVPGFVPPDAIRGHSPGMTRVVAQTGAQ